MEQTKKELKIESFQDNSKILKLECHKKEREVWASIYPSVVDKSMASSLIIYGADAEHYMKVNFTDVSEIDMTINLLKDLKSRIEKKQEQGFTLS